jgi:predicted NUDIX family NTP pyrophosphohydrolase
MAKVSAGVIVYRTEGGPLEVMLVHPGGPFWKTRSDGVWSIPKGEFDPDHEIPMRAALREFTEELGQPPPTGPFLDLGEVTQKGGKRVLAFAAAGDVDVSSIVSNTFTLEWPPNSGRSAEFPEVDRAEWFTVPAARAVINAAQTVFLDRLSAALATD